MGRGTTAKAHNEACLTREEPKLRNPYKDGARVHHHTAALATHAGLQLHRRGALLHNAAPRLRAARASLRASTLGNVRLLLPMIGSLPELREAKAVIDEVRLEPEREGSRLIGVSASHDSLIRTVPWTYR
mgnify:CR=1 FL=1